eukprot:m.80416 g.80416  ORF g.80416 m.80416 type:complete len:84 (+) comp36193_c0_seq1:509-760(+)
MHLKFRFLQNMASRMLKRMKFISFLINYHNDDGRVVTAYDIICRLFADVYEDANHNVLFKRVFLCTKDFLREISGKQRSAESL